MLQPDHLSNDEDDESDVLVNDKKSEWLIKLQKKNFNNVGVKLIARVQTFSNTSANLKD